MLYHPQQKIYSDTTITISPNTNYTLDLLIDDTVTTSTYTWFKDYVPYTIKGSNKLPFNPFTAADAGTYTVKITNPLAPQLTLESHPIRLVAGPLLVCDRRSDSLELVKFYNATGGPNWWKKWDLKKPLDSLFGIKLNPEGCVISILLNDTLDRNSVDIGNNLFGQFIDFKLPYLVSLDLRGSTITNNIIDFQYLPSLQHLFFPYGLQGTLPNFTKLSELRVLFLENNEIIGPLHDFSNMPKLHHLYLGQNKLSGNVPDFKNLPELSYIRVGNNSLSGDIPTFSKTPKLTFLDLNGNNLSGDIPDFTNLTNLTYLDLGNNNLIGVPNFNHLTKLQSLNLGDNELVGLIPNFENLKNLEFFSISDNNLTGAMPNYYSLIPRLTSATIDRNKFTFTHLIHNLSKNKNHIDITNKGLIQDTLVYAPQQKIYSDTTITIPPCTDFILDLKIDDTVTTSTYAWFKDGAPDTVIKGSNKRRFTNFNSAHVGTFTVKITNPLAPQLTLESHPIHLTVGTGLCCDRRSDSLELVKFYNSTGGPSNWWKKWDLSKPMNTWWGIELNPSGCVKTLRVSDTTLNGFTACCSGNNLVGSFPDIYLPELEVFHCQNNTGITGPIPNFNLPNLVELTIFTCMVNGSIPNFDKLPKLRLLNLHDNKLTGNIPDFRSLPNLENLNLSVNALSGSIPDFPSFQNLKFLELYTNMLSGAIPDFSQMPNLTLLYLQSNQLSDTIPNFRNLGSLTCMGVDNNMLSGSLPNFEFLKKLQVVGISNNMLSGFLPDYSSFNPSLATLTIDGNAYTFDGLVSNTIRVRDITQRITSPNCPGSPEIFVYHPQKKIYSDTTITIPACSDYILDLKIDNTVTTSTYAWFKNGLQDTIIIGSNKRRFSNFSPEKAGTYTVRVTNPLAPQLTLESHPIRLVSSGAATNINNPRDTSLTCGLSYRLPVITGQNLGSDAAYFTGPGRTGIRYASGQAITTDAILYAHTSSGGCFEEDTFSIRFTNPVLIARPDTVRTLAGKSVPFGVLDNDNIPAGLPTQVTIDNPANGSILYSTTTGRGTYTPDIGFVGTEVLNYMVCIVDCPASCKSSTLTIIVEGPCGDRNSLVLPNVIFPTGSGVNRYFIVEAITKCPDAWGPKPHKLEVFNRWGGLVYRNDNYLNDWDGTNTAGQPLPEGTYYYLLDLGSVAAPVRGYVVIMR